MKTSLTNKLKDEEGGKYDMEFGRIQFPPNSVALQRMEHADPYKKGQLPVPMIPIRSLRAFLDIEVDGEAKDMLVWLNNGFHNCNCHKLAALCFFEWTPEGEYKQVPLIKGRPETTNLVIGEVEQYGEIYCPTDIPETKGESKE